VIAVVGAGSMGSMFGGLLARAGHDVTLVDVDVAHVEAVTAHGLTLQQEGHADEVVRPAATLDPSSLRGVTHAIVLTKSWANDPAAQALLPALTDDAVVATVQNGLGNDRVLAGILGEHRVLGGTTTSGAELVAPGVVRLSPITTARGSLTEVAPVRPGLLEVDDLRGRAGALADLLTAAGLPTRVRDDLGEVVWTKLCLAATAAPLTAALRCTVEDLLVSPAASALLDAMFEEIVAVAAAEGVALDRDAVREHMLTVFRAVGPHQTSMAVDVAKGRRTEIDAMCVAIAARGAEHGVPTPTHEVVGRIIVAYEQLRGLRATDHHRATD
jgi:2-dehydropantoate 2-reductase